MTSFDDYYFLPILDSTFGDLKKVEFDNLYHLHEIANDEPNCIAFNTYGWLKTSLKCIILMKPIKHRRNIIEGTYIKKTKITYPERSLPTGFTNPLSTNQKGIIWCINLEYRTDRKETMIQEFTKHNIDQINTNKVYLNSYKFFKAIDKNKLTASEELKHLFRNCDFRHKRGIIACCLSHHSLYKQLYSDPIYDYYIIFEDDVKFEPDFKFKIHQVLSELESIEDWDIIFLGYFLMSDIEKIRYDSARFGVKIPRIQAFNQCLWLSGTFAYIINRKGAAKALATVERFGFRSAADIQIQHNSLDVDFKIYEVFPHLVKSEFVRDDNNVDSDIQRDHIILE